MRRAALAGAGALALLGASEARAGSVMAEGSAGGSLRTWTLLGDVELRKDETFLTLGYTGTRTQSETALSHQLSAGVDHALNEHWLLSGLVNVGLPKKSTTPLAPERPLLDLPAMSARTGYRSGGLQLAATYDSAGFSDVEYGLDAGLGLTLYGLDREIFTHQTGHQETLYRREEPLFLARPSLGARLLLVDKWELGVRGGLYLYSGDPLSSGQFTQAELKEVMRRYAANAAEGNLLVKTFTQRRIKELAVDLSGRLLGVNALTGFPSAPALFDVKPSVTYRFSTWIRGQLSYAFTRYVPGQGYAHVLGTRWTFRLADSFRFWASLALQSDHVQGEAPLRSGLATLGSELTF
ncbi:hypothetical protein [Vitiosangium sp. GDMCC 1.1324]|uniref:hypothetical protein n=1 Tax=Vitiosangium sp. (strain GDMCC 1.1324) TaxID=2138576 RepID=UPI000D3A210C|nr:hypothetical protein [Vitiosangium sp. GDMCC 1.1324]PTL76097.1 hypothetical protein DAT35_50910 [Vitiosangium sp. GDMCC 1.1324]